MQSFKAQNHDQAISQKQLPQKLKKWLQLRLENIKFWYEQKHNITKGHHEQDLKTLLDYFTDKKMSDENIVLGVQKEITKHWGQFIKTHVKKDSTSLIDRNDEAAAKQILAEKKNDHAFIREISILLDEMRRTKTPDAKISPTINPVQPIPIIHYSVLAQVIETTKNKLSKQQPPNEYVMSLIKKIEELRLSIALKINTEDQATQKLYFELQRLSDKLPPSFKIILKNIPLEISPQRPPDYPSSNLSFTEHLKRELKKQDDLDKAKLEKSSASTNENLTLNTQQLTKELQHNKNPKKQDRLDKLEKEYSISKEENITLMTRQRVEKFLADYKLASEDPKKHPLSAVISHNIGRLFDGLAPENLKKHDELYQKFKKLISDIKLLRAIDDKPLSKEALQDPRRITAYYHDILKNNLQREINVFFDTLLKNACKNLLNSQGELKKEIFTAIGLKYPKNVENDQYTIRNISQWAIRAFLGDRTLGSFLVRYNDEFPLSPLESIDERPAQLLAVTEATKKLQNALTPEEEVDFHNRIQRINRSIQRPLESKEPLSAKTDAAQPKSNQDTKAANAQSTDDKIYIENLRSFIIEIFPTYEKEENDLKELDKKEQDDLKRKKENDLKKSGKTESKIKSRDDLRLERLIALCEPTIKKLGITDEEKILSALQDANYQYRFDEEIMAQYNPQKATLVSDASEDLKTILNNYPDISFDEVISQFKENIRESQSLPIPARYTTPLNNFIRRLETHLDHEILPKYRDKLFKLKQAEILEKSQERNPKKDSPTTVSAEATANASGEKSHVAHLSHSSTPQAIGISSSLFKKQDTTDPLEEAKKALQKELKIIEEYKDQLEKNHKNGIPLFAHAFSVIQDKMKAQEKTLKYHLNRILEIDTLKKQSSQEKSASQSSASTIYPDDLLRRNSLIEGYIKQLNSKKDEVLRLGEICLKHTKDLDEYQRKNKQSRSLLIEDMKELLTIAQDYKTTSVETSLGKAKAKIAADFVNKLKILYKIIENPAQVEQKEVKDIFDLENIIPIDFTNSETSIKLINTALHFANLALDKALFTNSHMPGADKLRTMLDKADTLIKKITGQLKEMDDRTQRRREQIKILPSVEMPAAKAENPPKPK